MALTLTDVQQVVLGVSPTSAAGNAAPIENPSWSVSDDTLLSLSVSDDGLTATAASTGKLGSCQVIFNCDGKIGDGESPLMAVLDVNIVASEAVNITISAGTPEPISVSQPVAPDTPPTPTADETPSA